MTTALVTGASGFIGGRLVEKLILSRGWKVRALVRDFSRAARLARFDVQLFSGRTTDPLAIRRAMDGCQVVFHCAYDSANAASNVDAAAVVAEACLSSGVSRLIHASSIAVYQPLTMAVLDETTQTEPCGWEYADTKLEIEHRLLDYRAREGLPVVILQPTVVYGPFGKAWTADVVRQLRLHQLLLPMRGEGVCNAVYVDDVVDGFISAAEAPSVEGERILLSGPEPVTWSRFYRAFESILGTRSVIPVDDERSSGDGERAGAAGRATPASDRKTLARTIPRRTIRRLFRPFRTIVGQRAVKRLTRTLPGLRPVSVPRGDLLALYRSPAVVDIGKARSVLGYDPAFDFNRGMRLTEEFLRWANL